MITVAQLNWAAGLIEGEGSFTHHRNGDLVISVAMTDGDVIGRLHSVFGFGTVGNAAYHQAKSSIDGHRRIKQTLLG